MLLLLCCGRAGAPAARALATDASLGPLPVTALQLRPAALLSFALKAYWTLLQPTAGASASASPLPAKALDIPTDPSIPWKIAMGDVTDGNVVEWPCEDRPTPPAVLLLHAPAEAEAAALFWDVLAPPVVVVPLREPARSGLNAEDADAAEGATEALSKRAAGDAVVGKRGDGDR